MDKCERPDCGGNIITDWDNYWFCLLCGREINVPEPAEYVQPGHEAHWNKPRRTA